MPLRELRPAGFVEKRRLQGGLFLPGLNRMIARRQPSSVLSILMSRILDTSSVSTLERDLQVTQRSQLSQPWTRTSLLPHPF